MRLLLDTHILLRAAVDPDRLPSDARALMDAPTTELVFSAASLWEIAIKNSLGRRAFSVDPRLLRRNLLENDYRELSITGAQATTVDLLPPIHKDPFDRILIAQAQIEGLTLLTADSTLARYPGPIRAL